MRRILCAALLLLGLCCAAWAEEALPAGVLERMDGEQPGEYVLLSLPGGRQAAAVLDPDGFWLRIYLREGDGWERWADTLALDTAAGVRLIPHTADSRRADGSAWPEGLGFDVVSSDGRARQSWNWEEEGFRRRDWQDLSRYDGQVMVQGTVLCYYPTGSQTPEAEVDLGELTSACLDFLRDCPATPQEARQRAALRRDAVADRYPGYTLCGYSVWGGGAAVDAVYARLDGGLLYIKEDTLYADTALNSCRDLLPLPVSEATAQAPLETLAMERYAQFTQPGAFDPARLPLEGTVIDLHVQAGQLVLLVERQGQRRVAVVTRDAEGAYHTAYSKPLGGKASLDTFHAGEGDVYLYLGDDQLGYARTARGGWRLSWMWAQEVEFTVDAFGVHWMDSQTGDNTTLVGVLPGCDLLLDDPADLPRTQDALRRAVDRGGMAVVNNPNPADRLNLRVSPDRNADSYGKFYNGTPLRVLETRGDWCRVAVGDAGLQGWMMKKYLAFGRNMDSVAPAGPSLVLREEHEKGPVWADRARKTEKPLPGTLWRIVGVADDLYILLCADGDILYVPMDWMFEGNG